MQQNDVPYNCFADAPSCNHAFYGRLWKNSNITKHTDNFCKLILNWMSFPWNFALPGVIQSPWFRRVQHPPDKKLCSNIVLLPNDNFINWRQVLLGKLWQSVHMYRKERLKLLTYLWGLRVYYIDGSAIKLLIMNTISGRK